MGANDLISQLKKEGALERQGAFELDTNKAREKMQKFQLIDPHEYVLEFIQVAHLLGASRIDVFIDADEVEICFTGTMLSAEQLGDIYSASFRKRLSVEDRAMRHLAIGVSAAQAVNPAIITIEMGADRLTIRPELDDVLDTVDGATDGACRIYLKEQFRPSHLREFFRNFNGDLAEKQAIRKKCVYSPVPIWMDGEVINHGMRLNPEVESIVAFKTQSDYGLLGFVRNDQFSQVHLLQNGVLIQTNRMPSNLIAIEAIVSSSRLTTNLSQSAFVQDEAWHEIFGPVLKNALYDSVRCFLSDVFEHYEPYDLPIELSQWLKLIAHQLLEECVSQQRADKFLNDVPNLPDLMALIDHVPLIGVANALPAYVPVDKHQQISIDSLSTFGMSSKIKKIHYSKQRFVEQVLPDLPIVIKHDTQLIKQLCAYLDTTASDSTTRLRNAFESEVNQQRWQNSPHSETLSDRYRFCAEDRAQDVNVCWAWAASASQKMTSTVYVHNGHTLRVDKHQRTSYPVRLLIGGKLHVNKRFDHVKRDNVFKHHVLRAISIFPQVIDTWASQFVDSKSVMPSYVLDIVQHYVLDVFSESLIEELACFFDVPASFWGSSQFDRWYSKVTSLDEDGLWALHSDNRYTLLDSRVGIVDVVERFGVVARLPLFKTVGGKVCSLMDVALFLREHARVAWIEQTEYDALSAYEEQAILKVNLGVWGKAEDVLILTDTMEILLQRFITKSSWLHEVSKKLHKGLGRAEFLGRPELSLDLKKSGIPGKFGKNGTFVITDPVSTRNDQCHMTIEWLYKKRLLCRTQRPLPFGTIVARIDSAEIIPNVDWDGIDNTSFVDFTELHVLASAQSVLVKWIESLLEDMESLSQKDRFKLWSLAGIFYGKSQFWSKKGKSVRTILSNSPILTHARGHALSVEDVNDAIRLQSHKTLYIVYNDDAVMDEKMISSKDVVLRVPRTSHTLAYLEAIFAYEIVDVTTYDSELKAIEEAQRDFEKRPTLDIYDSASDSDWIVRRFEQDGWGGVLRIPKEHLYQVNRKCAKITLVEQGRELMAFEHPLTFGYVEVWAWHQTALPNWNFEGYRDATLHEGLGTLIEELQRFAWFDILEQIEQDPAAYRSVVTAIWSYFNSISTRINYDYFELLRAFEDTPLFPTAQGAWATKNEVDERHADRVPVVSPTMAKKDVVWPVVPVLVHCGARNVLAKLFHLESYAPITQRTPPPQVVLKSEAAVHDVALDPTTQSHDMLLERVYGLLLKVRGESRVLLGDVFLERLTMDAQSATLVRVDSKTVVIGGLHIMSRQCIEQPEDETALAFLASSVYSAINAYEDVITDEHEIAYQSLFVHQMVKSLGV